MTNEKSPVTKSFPVNMVFLSDGEDLGKSVGFGKKCRIVEKV